MIKKQLIINKNEYLDKTFCNYNNSDYELLLSRPDLEIVRCHFKQKHSGVINGFNELDDNKAILVLTGQIKLDPYRQARILTKDDLLSIDQNKNAYLFQALEDTTLLCIYTHPIYQILKNTVNKISDIMLQLQHKDLSTTNHCFRVQQLSMKLACKLDVNYQLLSDLFYAACYHDIGKITIPSDILLKPGPLSQEEKKIMRTHPQASYRMIKDIFGQNVAVMALQHHEKLDGSGYPLGIKGHQIGLGARIIAVADTFDAIVEGRPYSNKKSINEAIDILNSIKGTQLDATVVAALISILTEENLYHK